MSPSATLGWERRAAMTEPTAASHIGGTAIVVGASMAGLCAARVLADRFDSMLLLDRDTLPDGIAPRDRVPQGRQPHLLLVAGARLLEEWSPASSASYVRRAPSTSTSVPTSTGTKAVA
jgi:2-polyprenyl-6-methoxyphenol hydroxylase-like FAD-dependent oxidoreductase